MESTVPGTSATLPTGEDQQATELMAPDSPVSPRRSTESYMVQQAAALTGLSEHNLRYYKRIGLIEPVRRQESSGHRRYGPDDLAKLESIACLRATGMPIDQMRRYFELRSEGAYHADAVELQVLLSAHLAVLITILATMLSLVLPLLRRDLIDRALPEGDATRLGWLSLGMVLVPLASGRLGILQGWLSAQVGHGIVVTYEPVSTPTCRGLSLRSFTNTRSGELPSRMNNDVLGAQNAITGTMLGTASINRTKMYAAPGRPRLLDLNRS